jgi:Xaa-Pro dipeptidase
MELRSPSPRFVGPTNILSFGVRTTLGGPYPSGAKLRKGDMVMMDVCNEYDGYAGDITRMKVFGTPTREQREIYDVNLQMDEKAINAIRPGARAREMWDAIVKVAREAGYEKYIRPCVSHGIGLDVHEKPDIGVDETRLVPNMVLTCEPAICGRNLGTSIEDMVLVTETGRELLTKYEKSLQL